MTKPFEVVEEISQKQFIETWQQEEADSCHEDPFTLDRIKELRDANGLKCFVIRFTEAGLGSVILPAHKHDNVWRVCEPGEPYSDVIGKYLAWRSSGQDDGCFKRLIKIGRFIDTCVDEASSLWESRFLLGRIFQAGDPTLPEHYRKPDRTGLHTLNFHRFVAYGLWCADHGYEPAKAHYFARSTTGI